MSGPAITASGRVVPPEQYAFHDRCDCGSTYVAGRRPDSTLYASWLASHEGCRHPETGHRRFKNGRPLLGDPNGTNASPGVESAGVVTHDA